MLRSYYYFKTVKLTQIVILLRSPRTKTIAIESILTVLIGFPRAPIFRIIILVRVHRLLVRILLRLRLRLRLRLLITIIILLIAVLIDTKIIIDFNRLKTKNHLKLISLIMYT